MMMVELIKGMNQTSEAVLSLLMLAIFELLQMYLLLEQWLKACLGIPSINDFLLQQSWSSVSYRYFGKTFITSRQSLGSWLIISVPRSLLCFEQTSMSLSNLYSFDRLLDPKLDILDVESAMFIFYCMGLVFSGLRDRLCLGSSEQDLLMKSLGLSLILMGLSKSVLEGSCWWVECERMFVRQVDFLIQNKEYRVGLSSRLELFDQKSWFITVFNYIATQNDESQFIGQIRGRGRGTAHSLISWEGDWSEQIQVIAVLIYPYKVKLNSQMDPQQHSNGDSIQVLVRIKPGCEEEAVLYTPTEIKLEKHSFAFDRIFSPQSHQDDIFNAVGKKVISHTLEGYNGCIFVYGQTGSGKTYTMMGNNNGLMQRSFSEIFSKIDRLAQTECIVSCSYYELYNEQIIDLLDVRKDKKSLSIRQDVKRGMFVENLTEESALNPDKLLECLNLGMKNRHIGETMMNRESSRSHSIFTISLAIKSEIDGKKVLKTPKLHFVDLAGSERQKMTMSSGERLKQAGNINKSLTTLGMVINALASDKAKTHIPYRDSKLTCLLRDSLGGNSKTFIVATISTSILCFQETLSTLNFANRAKMVKVKALINEESLSTNIEHFKEEIRKLRQEIAKLKSEKRVNFENHTSAAATDSVISKSNGDFTFKFEELSHKIEDLKSNMSSSAMDNMIDMFNKASCMKMKDQNDNVESVEMEEEGTELIEYMHSNHELLKKIHSTVHEYTTLREEIKNVQFSRRMPLEEMKTPSKFERDQYELLLVRRDDQIKALEEKIVALKEINVKKDADHRELKKRMSSIEDHNESKDERMIRMKQEQEDLQKRCMQTQLKYELLQEERSKLQRVRTQLEMRIKEEKELYHYTEEKYENQRFIKTKLETSIKQLNKKMQNLDQERREEIENYKEQFQLFEEQLLEKERREEELKIEIDILNETLEFDKKKIKEYSEKIADNFKVIQELQLSKFQAEEKVAQVMHEKQSLVIEYQSIIKELNLKNKELTNNLTLLQEELSTINNEHELLQVEYDSFKNNARQKIQVLEGELSQTKEMERQSSGALQTLQVEHQKSVYEHQKKIGELERSLDCTRAELIVGNSLYSLLEEKYTNEVENWQKESQRMAEQITSLGLQLTESHEQLEARESKIAELETQVLSTRNIVEEHEQLKKTYKEIIKQNYKLKGEYISTSTSNLSEYARNEELISKVAYYEQKFRLMSLEYNKVQEISKKLKQKELALIKKLQYYEESEKLKKIHSSSEAEEVKGENYRSLQLENAELKETISKMTRLYESKMHLQKKEDYSKKMNLEHEKYELEQRQEKIRKKLESAIKNWDHAKENNWSGMNLDELFGCWEKIQQESRKKIEGINRSIKREQKLKIQNGFIIKQNAYLKERVEGLERDINLSALGEPRKLVKPNQEFA